ncbi:hypothetical protein MASR2M52_13590 [Pedobacter sp.]
MGVKVVEESNVVLVRVNLFKKSCKFDSKEYREKGDAKYRLKLMSLKFSKKDSFLSFVK